MRYVEVMLDGHLAGRYPYRIPAGTQVGQGAWALVPWGRQQRIGIVAGTTDQIGIDPGRVRDLIRILDDLPAMPPDWFRLLEFAAAYYHVDPAELALEPLFDISGEHRVPAPVWERVRANFAA